MTCDDARNITLRQTRKSFSLVILMLLFSVSPLLSSPIITAHDSQSLYNVWDKTGTNDTGWVLLEATGADPATGQPAYADWNLDFAPGAEIANLTFEVQVNGSAGVSIDEPKLFPVNTGDLLFDYGGYGTF